MGLIYTVGRSAGNYRLFDEEVLWCVGLIGILPGLGLTLAGDPRLAEIYLREPGSPIGIRLAESLPALGRSAASSSDPHRTNPPASMRGWRVRRLIRHFDRRRELVGLVFKEVERVISYGLPG